jgi:uncharacterized protein involved in exopolysaccharide biosynthesis
MALTPITPRDRLQRLVDLGRKTWRYWWLIAVFAVVGGGLSLVFALTRPRNFQSWATLFYQERIQSQLLSPNREEVNQRNIGDRYRELLLARRQLDQIIADPALDPYPEIPDPDLKIDKLRLAVHFEARGANAFRIVFNDSDPDRVRRVTDKLTKLLAERDEALRNEQAAATVAFITEQKEAAATELKKREQKFNEFLAKHPEFVSDANNAQNEGASIRAIRTTKANTGNNRLYALERQRQRIQARLDAPPNAPPVNIPSAPTPERIAADAQVADAQRELASANRELEDAMSKFTEKHPSVIKAQERVASATQRLRHAQAAVPPDIDTPLRPATPEDRVRLQRELTQLEAQISAEQSKSGKSTEATDAATNWVVQLETEHADLRRGVNEQRERVQSLADSAFRATMDANQKLAEQGGRLSVIDPAFRPVRPSGPGKTIFLMAGMILFLTLGLSFAIGLAVIDDRLYRRADLDQLGIAVLAVIPPAQAVKRKRKREPRAKQPPTGEAA